MARVQRNFVVIEYVEFVVIFVAAVVAMSIVLKGRPGLMGVALGLLISASVLLAFDLYADRRGAEYLAAIRNGQRLSPQ